MPHTAPELIASVLAIAFAAGLIQGLTGFGAALIAVPLLVLLLPVETAVPLMALLAMVISSLNLLHLRNDARLSPVIRLLAGYLIGTPLGLYVLTRAAEDAMLAALGVFLAGYAVLSLSGRQPRPRWLREWRVGLGAVSGALGSAFSTNGPPIILHVSAHPEWDADRQKATLVLYFLLASGITVTAHAVSGLVTGEVLAWFAWSIPMLVAGTLTGVRLYRRLGQHNYRQLTFVLILLIGLGMIARAVQTGP